MLHCIVYALEHLASTNRSLRLHSAVSIRWPGVGTLSRSRIKTIYRSLPATVSKLEDSQGCSPTSLHAAGWHWGGSWGIYTMGTGAATVFLGKVLYWLSLPGSWLDQSHVRASWGPNQIHNRALSGLNQDQITLGLNYLVYTNSMVRVSILQQSQFDYSVAMSKLDASEAMLCSVICWYVLAGPLCDAFFDFFPWLLWFCEVEWETFNCSMRLDRQHRYTIAWCSRQDKLFQSNKWKKVLLVLLPFGCLVGCGHLKNSFSFSLILFVRDLVNS